MVQTAHTSDSPTPALVQLAIVVLLGLVLLPTLLGSGSGLAQGTVGTIDPLSAVWLVVAIALVLWLLVIVERLIRLLEGKLAVSPAFRVLAPSQAPSSTFPHARLLASLVLIVGYVLLSEAILRRPLAAVLGVYVEPTLVDAAVATVALVLVLALLIRLYRVARPLVKATAWYVLDGVIATSGSDRVQRFYEADETRAATTAIVGADSTRQADATVASGEATVVASDTGKTRFAPSDESEATRLELPEDVEATQLAPSDDSEATQLGPADDKTLFQRKPPANPTSG